MSLYHSSSYKEKWFPSASESHKSFWFVAIPTLQCVVCIYIDWHWFFFSKAPPYHQLWMYLQFNVPFLVFFARFNHMKIISWSRWRFMWFGLIYIGNLAIRTIDHIDGLKSNGMNELNEIQNHSVILFFFPSTLTHSKSIHWPFQCVAKTPRNSYEYSTLEEKKKN